MWQTMKKRRASLVIGLMAIAAIFVGMIFFYQRAEVAENEDHAFSFDAVETEYRPYARLAAEAFAEKQGMSSVDRAMLGRNISVERSEDDICIRLVVIPPGMGESPIYCYKEGTTQLTRKFDDVE